MGYLSVVVKGKIQRAGHKLVTNLALLMTMIVTHRQMQNDGESPIPTDALKGRESDDLSFLNDRERPIGRPYNL